LEVEPRQLGIGEVHGGRIAGLTGGQLESGQFAVVDDSRQSAGDLAFVRVQPDRGGWKASKAAETGPWIRSSLTLVSAAWACSVREARLNVVAE
jgi:hypothetical protein